MLSVSLACRRHAGIWRITRLSLNRSYSSGLHDFRLLRSPLLPRHRLSDSHQGRWFSSAPPRRSQQSVKQERESEPRANSLESKSSKTSSDPSSEGKAFNRKTILQDLRRLFQLAKPETLRLIAALVCLVGTSTVTMLLPLVIGKIIDTARLRDDDSAEPPQGDMPAEFPLGLLPNQFYSGLVVLFVIGSVCNFGRFYLLKSVGERMVARLRARLFGNILSQDSYFFDVGPARTGMKTGDLVSRLTSDTQVISKSLSGNISEGVRAVISGTVGISMMCWVSWKLTLCMSLIFPPLILMSTVYGRRVKQLSRVIQDSLGSLTKVLEEKLNGLKTIQVFAQQRSVMHEYNAEVRDIYNKSMLEGKISGIYYSINGFLGNVTIVGLLAVGSRLIASGEISIGDLSSFMMYAIYTGSSIFGLGSFYTELMKGIGAAERVFELVDLRPKIPISVGRKVDNLHGDIQIKNALFAYPSRLDSTIFDNVDLHIRKGEHVCFVGPSGSGKSTISQLLLRFYDPLSGEILVNGHNISDLNLNFYRAKIGYVQQEPLLFSGTIRDNITFGKRDSTQEDIDYATRLSNCQSFIDGFPQKLDTEIGPSSSGSAQLSGGQKQRISLARTLIKRPDILILDEATSALDSRLEEIVMKNLSELSRESQPTVISIAHRLSTIQNSDRIIVLDQKGRIVEDGPFDELHSNESSRLNKLLKTGEFAEGE